MRFHYASGSRPLDGYTIRRGLGRGGFGEVYYAISDAGKEVAAKLVERNLDIERRGVLQALNIRHGNLIETFDIRESDQGETWILMEYADGPTLDQRLDDSPEGLPVAEALRWADGLLDGVEALHRHGIVHRDLKPANIFQSGGQVKVGDYGLSKFITTSRREGHTQDIGTVHYMSPEVGQGRYGPEVDIYAIGAILYEMLTGRPPFEGDSAAEILMKHLTATPDLNKLPAEFRPVVGRALAKDPSKRFASIADLRSALHLRETGPETPVYRTPVRPGIESPAQGRHPEPLALFLRDLLHRHPAVGASVLVVLGLAGMAQPRAMVGLLILYAVYFAVFKTVQMVLEPSATRLAGEPMTAAIPQRSVARKKGRRRSVVLELPPKTSHQWWRELFASWIAASFWVSLWTAVVAAIWHWRQFAAFDPVELGIVVGVGTAASGLILYMCKFWERSRDDLYQRFVLGSLGVPIGVLAWAMEQWLADGAVVSGTLWMILADADAWRSPQAMSLVGHIGYFVLLLFSLKWWQYVHPLRSRRMQVGPVVAAALLGVILTVIWPAVGSEGFVWAPLLATTVQLAAPHQLAAARRYAAENMADATTAA